MADSVDRFIVDCAMAAVEVPFARYQDWALDGLARLVRFESACWGIGTHVPAVTHAVHLRGVSPALLIAYEDGVVELDYVRAAAAAEPGVTINDYDIRDGFPQAADLVDARISAPFGLEQALATSLPHEASSGLQHLILLWRSGRRDQFSEADRQCKQRCAPHLVAGFRVAQRLHLATTAAADDVRGHALVDGFGVLHSFDDRFVRLLRRQWPDWGGPRLPDAIADGLAARELTLPRLSVTIAERGALLALAITERPIDPLTPAQRRVAELYAGGLTHREIAVRLGLAPATVRNQVAQAFARLGVASKLALAERLRALT